LCGWTSDCGTDLRSNRQLYRRVDPVYRGRGDLDARDSRDAAVSALPDAFRMGIASRSLAMETQNGEVTGYFTSKTDEKEPTSRYSRPAQLERRNHGDMPVKTRLGTPKRMTLNPGAADEDGAVNSPPAVDIAPFFLVGPYPITVATHGSVGWALATL